MPKATRIGDRSAFLFFLAVILLAAYAFWASLQLFKLQPVIKVGKAVDCQARPSYEHMRKYCRINAYGPACAYESQNETLIWFDQVDTACSQFDPDVVFVVRTYRDLHWDDKIAIFLADFFAQYKAEPERVEVASN